MNENYGYLIYIASREVGKYFDQSIHKLIPGITGVQFTILIYLYRNRKKIITQRMITKYLHLQHPTVRHIIKLMLKKNLINSGSLPSDHRQIQIMISSQGQQLIKANLKAINHDFKRVNQLIINGMNVNEQRTLNHALKQIINNFEE